MKSVRAERCREKIVRERQRPISRTAYILGLRRNKGFRKIKAGKSLIHADDRLGMSTPRKTASEMSITAGKVQYRLCRIIDQRGERQCHQMARLAKAQSKVIIGVIGLETGTVIVQIKQITSRDLTIGIGQQSRGLLSPRARASLVSERFEPANSFERR